jgi:hypothetical protein
MGLKSVTKDFWRFISVCDGALEKREHTSFLYAVRNWAMMLLVALSTQA